MFIAGQRIFVVGRQRVYLEMQQTFYFVLQGQVSVTQVKQKDGEKMIYPKNKKSIATTDSVINGKCLAGSNKLMDTSSDTIRAIEVEFSSSSK